MSVLESYARRAVLVEIAAARVDLDVAGTHLADGTPETAATLHNMLAALRAARRRIHDLIDALDKETT